MRVSGVFLLPWKKQERRREGRKMKDGTGQESEKDKKSKGEGVRRVRKEEREMNGRTEKKEMT